MIKNQKGFTLSETFLGLFLMAGVGVAGMQLSKSMKDAKTTVSSSNELNRTMIEIRTMLRDPAICEMNFKYKSVDYNPEKIIDNITPTGNVSGDSNSNSNSNSNSGPGNSNSGSDSNSGSNSDSNATPEKFKVGAMMSKSKYRMTDIKLTKVDALRRRAFVTFSFTKEDSARGAISSINKTISLFVEATGTQITKCIDPVTLSSEAILDNLCFEADPLNPGANDTDCLNNLQRLANEMKQLYCENHPLFVYSGGRCQPVHAGMDCGPGKFLQGISLNGRKICYTPPVPVAPAQPVACVDSSWTLVDDPANVCNTEYIDEISNCGNARTSSTMGTRTCTAPGCPGPLAVNWGSGNVCQGSRPAAGDGSTKVVTNVTAGYDGTIKYNCNAGAWNAPTDISCLQRCAAGTLNWPTPTSACQANITEAPSSATPIPLTNVTANHTGDSSWICTNGTWTVEAGSTCEASGSSTGSSGSGGCFIAGTKVKMGDGSEKNIEDIQTGDLVFSFDERNNVVRKNLVTTPLMHKAARQELYSFHLSNGRKFTSNDVHPLYMVTSNSWINAREVAEAWLRGENPILLGMDQREVSVIFVGKTEKIVKVYNMEVTQDHNYFVEGVLVHNKTVIDVGDTYQQMDQF